MLINKNEEIKRELYKSYLILVKNLYQQSDPNENTPQIGAKRKRFLVGSVIFLAFAMESFINDFGDRFVEDFKDFEKIDSLNKFLLFPKIAKVNPSKIIKKNEISYSALKQLFKYRNYFVHYKPIYRSIETNEEKLYTQLDHEIVKNLYKEMIKILKKFNDHFLIFENDNDWITSYSDDINF